MRISLGAALAAASLLCCAPAGAAESLKVTQQDLTQLSLQELLDVQVTSVSKHAEPLRHAAAAVTVITGEDMRRTGARTLAQALRLVPGLQVYRTNAFNYTVTSRGFSGDKLEVLLDGRSVYSPLTSTVFWDVLDTSLNDVDRIEVIRGPGGTLWGANAVNGVINIVTRDSSETVGNALRAGGGVEERAYGTFRSGLAVGDAGHARFFAKAVDRDSSVQRTGQDSYDAQRLALVGLRSDWKPTRAQKLTVVAGVYRGTEMSEDVGPAFARAGDTEVSGAHQLSRWTWQPSKDSELSVQTYYDGYHRDIPDVFEEDRDTFDLQAQHRLQFGWIDTAITYGAGYRSSTDDTGGPPRALIFEPASRTLNTSNTFVQGQRRLGQGGELTVGTKLEHNESTGYEWQPGVRLGWELGEHFFTWGSVSRAVRLPNRLDEDVALFCAPPLDAVLGCTPGTTLRLGSRSLDSEKVIAYEWGLRGWTDERLSFDLTTFYNRYTDLRTTETNPPPLGSFANKLDADSFGAELAATWTPLNSLRVRPFYAFLEIDADPHADSTDANTARNLEGGSPRHSAGLQVGYTPWSNVTMDGFLRHVGRIERQQVPAYTDLNLRIGWRPLPSLELALVGADLFDDSHAEAGTAPSSTNPTPGPPAFEVERAVWVDVLWQWR
jgi:iron complex outermembrane receptor protein